MIKLKIGDKIIIRQDDIPTSYIITDVNEGEKYITYQLRGVGKFKTTTGNLCINKAELTKSEEI